MQLRKPSRVHVLCAGWLAFAIVAFPGYMSSDSVDQLVQARSGVYHDWHPPVMALIWSWADRIVAGPLLMLALQSALFLLGVDAVLRRVLRPLPAAALAVAVLLFPSTTTPMMVIWKDSQLAGFLAAGIGCITSPSRRWRWAGVGLLVLASAQRYNAPAATLPVVVLLLGAGTGWRRYVRAVLVWLGVTAAAVGANAALTDVHRYPWQNSLALYDIAGTLQLSRALPDAEIEDLLEGVPLAVHADIQKRMHAAYRPFMWWPLIADATKVFVLPATEAERDAIAAAWVRVVREHKWAYTVHRWRVFKRVVGLDNVPMGVVYGGFTEFPDQEQAIHQQLSHSAVQDGWLAFLHSLESSGLFRPYVFLLLALALLPLSRARLPLALLLSGVACELTLFVAAPSADYRYSHWMIACTLVALVLVFCQRGGFGLNNTGPGVAVGP